LYLSAIFKLVEHTRDLYKNLQRIQTTFVLTN